MVFLGSVTLDTDRRELTIMRASSSQTGRTLPAKA